jgi:nicotinate phosphoribosyltransferase
VTGPLGLYTDFYELTMAAAYHAERRDEVATFDLFVRSLPPTRDFLVVCGIDTALDALDRFRYDTAAIDYLRGLSLFDEAFLDRLARLEMRGEVWAMAEGELVFAGEPLLTISAPLIEAQLVETLLINLVGVETMIASKAARVTLAAAARPFVDFSARRDHGLEAALAAARASWVAGAGGTSLVEAGRRFGIPVSGTMAHSYVMAHQTEEDAYAAFLRRYGGNAVLLIDTYDTVEGARRAADVMTATGITARGVRLDSGDLDRLSRQVRAVLDDAGYTGVQILASGDLDEYRVADLVGAGAPIDAFGVGTRMGTSDDAPSLGMVYKLAEQAGQPRLKLSAGKETLPGRKQVWRTDGTDVIGLVDEDGPPNGRPLLRPVWRDGRRLEPSDLGAARLRCAAALAAAPITRPRIVVSDTLQQLYEATAAEVPL